MKRHEPRARAIRAALALLIALALGWSARVARQESAEAGRDGAPAPLVSPGAAASPLATALTRAPSLMPSPSPSGRRRWSVAEAEEFLRGKDTCRAIRELDRMGLETVEIANALDAGSPAASQSPRLGLAKALIQDPARLGSVAGLDGDASEIARFFHALSLGGLLSGGPPAPRDLPRSFAGFGALIEERPSNGALYFFRAAVRKAMGQEDRLVREDLMAAAAAAEFDTYLLRLTQAVYEWGLRSPQHHLLAQYLLSGVAIPDYSAHKLVKQLIPGDAAFAARALELGERMMDVQLRGVKRREVVFWFAVEYQVGLVIAKEAWRSLHPGQAGETALPAKLRKTYRDFYRTDPFLGHWEKAWSAGADCDSSLISRIVDEESLEYRRAE